MFALTSATVRRLIVISRELGDREDPEVDLASIDDRAIHFAFRTSGYGELLGVGELSLSLRLRDKRGTRGARVSIATVADPAAVLDRLVPISVVLEDLALRELEAWREVDAQVV